MDVVQFINKSLFITLLGITASALLRPDPNKLTEGAEQIFGELLANETLQAHDHISKTQAAYRKYPFLPQTMVNRCLDSYDAILEAEAVARQELPYVNRNRVFIESTGKLPRANDKDTLCISEFAVADTLFETNKQKLAHFRLLNKELEKYPLMKNGVKPAIKYADRLCRGTVKSFIKKFDELKKLGFPSEKAIDPSLMNMIRKDPDAFCPK